MSPGFLALLVAYTCSSAGGLLLMRHELRRDDSDLLSLSTLTNWTLLAAFGLYALSFFFWLLAIERYELTTVYPFFIGLAYAVLMVAAVVLLGEDMGPVKVAGVVLVGVGLLLIASSSDF